MKANELMPVRAFTQAGIGFLDTEIAGAKMRAVVYPTSLDTRHGLKFKQKSLSRRAAEPSKRLET